MAQRSLFDQFHGGLFGYLRALCGDAELAADLTQETFVRALSQLPRLREPQAFAAWLYRIARNLARDHAAKARPESAPDAQLQALPDPRGDASAPVLAAELSAAVDRALASLSPDHREVVVLHHLQGLEVEAIAALVGQRPGTVKSRLARAREALRRKLAPWLEGRP